MIIGSLTQTKRFEILHPDFKKVFEYVRSGDWQQVTAGKIILEEDKIWVNVDEVTGKSREAAKLEAHNRFIDIQIPLLQEETFGWEERGRLAMEEEEGYQVQNDILFYQERRALYVTLPVGDFVIFFPEDAHAPCIGNGKMKKMVVKVKL